MPHPFDTNRLNFTHGLKGIKDKTYVVWSVDGTIITGRLTRMNRPNELLTIALPLPKGYFTTAAGRTHSRVPIADPWIMISAIGASFLLWYLWGKERKIFPTVEFYPPSDLTPADAAYIMNSYVRQMDVISFIIYWADKGYLHISDIAEGKSEFLLRKLREMGSEVKPYEKKLFDAMFGEKADQVTTSTLASEGFYSDLDKARDEVKSYHNGNPKTRIFKKVALKLLLVAAPSIVCLFIVMIDAIGYFLTVLFALMALNYSVKFVQRIAQKTIIMALIYAAVIVMMFLGPLFLTIAVLVGPFLSVQLAILFMPTLQIAISKHRTDLGLKYLGLLTGFKTFIEKAERDRIDMLANENPQYFYNVLPYAVTLGVTDTWAQKFEHIGFSSPEWYNSADSGETFSASNFTSSLYSGLSEFERSVDASRPSSDSGGSSDGGSSGGGSGGGSGSSW
jgi:uncharacterized membrane protein YgcG